MQNELTLPILEEDIRIGLVLLADASRFMLGMGDRGNAAAQAILGMTDVPDEMLDDCIGDPDFLKSVQIADTQFLACVKLCHKVISEIGPLEQLDFDTARTEGAQWLSYFLSLMPREAMGGNDYTGTFHHPDAPLRLLLDKCTARIDLAEFVQELITKGEFGIGFSPYSVSLLGDMNVRTVRNVFSPSGNKPIRSKALKGHGKRSDQVWGDPLDVIEWLAGRRGFKQGHLSADWVNDKLPQVDTLEAAAAIPGVFAWLQQVQTEELEQALGWNSGDLRNWTRAKAIKVERAGSLAEAVGLDAETYTELIRRLTSP